MDLKQLFQAEEDRAVSPVIGVILMVAITVILAAVIGAFVIGIGGEQDNAPTASIDFDESVDTLTISHQSGAALDTNEITFSGDVAVDDGDFNDADITEIDDIAGIWGGDDDQITAGENIEVASDANANDEDLTEGPWPILSSGEGSINVVWESSDTDSSSVIASHDFDIDDYDDW